ncbi:serine/threonine protein kinase, negative regulator of sexual conjugation and meiosis [Suillus paluster]|uniref:serine/threonine protein kinase, negative regulator of sexual conjugation and meiosis n=1 Tax=Suillus paluster TaxID=48578 RepID=UPI001B8870F2|nr:serine/threonine protein kinase, negative regulator of sexual conjugation and meiosis [Suillus paluster]KAG1721689.1 serine/threonine protein kinase, negative regulator of sexual conjugation and meiosis [Suillus paluster]
MDSHREGLPIPNLSGQSVGDSRFKLVELIGFGASGTVYRALDTQSDPCDPVYYAIKCLPNTNISRDCLVWHRREIVSHSLVSRETSSPYICRLHETIAEGPYIYLVLDYCPGGDLFTAIRMRKYEGDVTLIKRVFLELLDGVHACHKIGVYHRDLKPENILCVESGSGIRIADFGLSTTDDRSREFNVGSWEYISPECNSEARSSDYSPIYSDLWSLGVILVNMVTGRSPWGTAEPSDPDFWRYLDNADFLLEVLPISRSFNKILKRIFDINPYSRMSALELRDEIIQLESFYPSYAERCATTDNTREAARGYARRFALLTNMTFHQVEVVDSAPPDSYSDNGAPRPQQASAPAVLRPSNFARVDDNRPWSRASLLSTCSTCSFLPEESEELATPETRPYEPSTGWSEGQKINEPMFTRVPAQTGPTSYYTPPTHTCLCEVRVNSFSEEE